MSRFSDLHLVLIQVMMYAHSNYLQLRSTVLVRQLFAPRLGNNEHELTITIDILNKWFEFNILVISNSSVSRRIWKTTHSWVFKDFNFDRLWKPHSCMFFSQIALETILLPILIEMSFFQFYWGELYYSVDLKQHISGHLPSKSGHVGFFSSLLTL